MAQPEFEAWLAADFEAVRTAADDPKIPPLHNVDTRAPREAKRYLDDLATKKTLDDSHLRITLAGTCDLERVARTCASFDRFVKDLR